MRRSFLVVLALCGMTMLFVGAVIASSQWLRGARVDLTEDGLYTLSPGTERILDGLQRPIHLSLFFSRHATRDQPQLRSYEQRVREMLREMATRAHGRIKLEIVDPVPYSDDEDRAFGYGLTAMPGGSNGERVFFGLAGSNVAGTQLAIPFFDPGKESFLEYDIAKLIYELNAPRKPRVGVISSLPVDGDAITGAKQWAIMRQLHQLFDVRTIDAGSLQTVGKDIQVLLLIHPQHLPDDALYAIDQYVLRGGHLVVFVDPDAEMDARAVSSLAGSIVGSSSDLPRLFAAWGVAYDPQQVVLDRDRALSIALGDSTQPLRHPAMLGFNAQDLNHNDVITAGLQNIDVSSAGYFELADDNDSRLVPLLQSSGDAMATSADRVRLTTDPTDLFDNYQPADERYVIAARVRGTFSSAFPERAKQKGHIARASTPQEVVLVADSDILSDRLWVQPTPFLGEQLLSAFANNGDFVANIIDNLSGSSALISIRGRATSQRPFTRVLALRRAADEKFRIKERELERELVDTERRLKELQPGKGGTAGSDDVDRKRELDEFLKRKLAIRRELRDVQHQLNAEIDALGARLKFIDILLVPLLLSVLGILYAFWRGRRAQRPRRD